MIRELINEINETRFRQYIHGFTREIQTSFTRTIDSPWYILHILAIIVTVPLVASGFDWSYFVFFRRIAILQPLLFPAVMFGGLVPFFLPPIIYLYGKLKEQPQLIPLALAMTQTAVVGLFWSSLYKAFSGRMGPEFDEFEVGMENYSNNFTFGFLFGGVFDGWPSGHTTIAFALATVFYLYRPDRDIDYTEVGNDLIAKLLQNRWIGIIFALYVGFGISTNIHWFSDFIAGILIGITVGRATVQTFEEDIDTEDLEQTTWDRSVKMTFAIIFLIIIFSIIVPRELLMN